MKLGIRAHDFGPRLSDKAQDLAQNILKAGFSHVQLAPWKSFLDMGDSDFTESQCHTIAKSLKPLEVSVLGAYFNMHDEQNAPLGEKRFKDMLEYASIFRAPGVATETGSYRQDWGYTPENHSLEAYAKTVRIFERLVQKAEDCNSCVFIEPAFHHCIGTIPATIQILRDISSPKLKIIFDPVNLLNIDTVGDQERLIKESFDCLGNHMSAVHFKDFFVESGVMKICAAGGGWLNYPLLLKMTALFGLKAICEELPSEEWLRNHFFL